MEERALDRIRSVRQLWRVENMDKHLLLTMQQTAYTEWWSDIEQYARRAISEPLPALHFELFRQFEDEGQRIPYEQVYFERRGRLGALALILLRLQAEQHRMSMGTRIGGANAALRQHTEHEQVWNRNEVLTALEEALWDVCGEYTWCLPAHLPSGAATPAWQEIDLFSAETAGMLAELSILLAGMIDQRIIERMHLEIRRRVLDVLVDQERHFGWETAEHNWSAVCASGCGIAGLLVEQHDERQQLILKRVLKALDYFLRGYGDDGGCAEGIGYWVYGFGYFTYLIDMLEATGYPVQLSEAQQRKIRAIAAFPQATHLSSGVFVNFSDSEERQTLPTGLLSRLAQRQALEISLPLELPLFSEDHCHRWAHVLRDLLWSEPEHRGVDRTLAYKEATRTTDAMYIDMNEIGHYWHNLEWLVVPGRVGFAAKGGHNDEPHNHNDLGSFIIHGGGQNLLCDPGAGMYTQAYFAPGREAILHISSAGHSVPCVNGLEQQSGREHTAVVLDIEQRAQETLFALELAAAYPEAAGLQSFIRHFHWQPLASEDDSTSRAELEVHDRFIFKEQIGANNIGVFGVTTGAGIQISERFMSRIKPQLGEHFVLWQGEQALVRLDIDRERYEVDIEELASHDHEGQPITLYRTKLTVTWNTHELNRAGEIDRSIPDASILDAQKPDLHCAFVFTVISQQ